MADHQDKLLALIDAKERNGNALKQAFGEKIVQLIEKEYSRVIAADRCLGIFYYEILSAPPEDRINVSRHDLQTGDFNIRQSLPGPEQVPQGLFFPVSYNTFILDPKIQPGTNINDYIHEWGEYLQGRETNLDNVLPLSARDVEVGLYTYFITALTESTATLGREIFQNIYTASIRKVLAEKAPQKPISTKPVYVARALTDAFMDRPDAVLVFGENAPVFIQSLWQSSQNANADFHNRRETILAQRSEIRAILEGVQEAAKKHGDSKTDAIIRSILTTEETAQFIDLDTP